MVKHSVESLLRLLKIFDGRSVAMPEGFWDWIILNLLQRCEELLKLQNQFSKSQSEVLEFRQICLEVISDVFSRQDSWSKLVNSFTNVVNKLKSFDWEASFQSEVYLVLVKEISVYLDGVDVETLKIFVNDQRFK